MNRTLRLANQVRSFMGLELRDKEHYPYTKNNEADLFQTTAIHYGK